jgi:hypothetical protein
MGAQQPQTFSVWGMGRWWELGMFMRTRAMNSSLHTRVCPWDATACRVGAVCGKFPCHLHPAGIVKLAVGVADHSHGGGRIIEVDLQE